jgi:tetratricopeptide (TPR) repeat protein
LSNESLDLAKKGNFPAAVQSAREALVLEPENAIAHFNLGLLLADSGDLGSAILELRKAISLAPFLRQSLPDAEEGEGPPGRHGQCSPGGPSQPRRS